MCALNISRESTIMPDLESSLHFITFCYCFLQVLFYIVIVFIKNHLTMVAYEKDKGIGYCFLQVLLYIVIVFIKNHLTMVAYEKDKGIGPGHSTIILQNQQFVLII